MPMYLTNDFAHPKYQYLFKIERLCAMLIQKFVRPDSIVAHFCSIATRGRFLQPNLPQADSCVATKNCSIRSSATRASLSFRYTRRVMFSQRELMCLCVCVAIGPRATK